MSGVILWIFTAIIAVITTVNAAGLKCDGVRPIFEAQGFPLSDIPKEAISCELNSCSDTLFVTSAPHYTKTVTFIFISCVLCVKCYIWIWCEMLFV